MGGSGASIFFIIEWKVLPVCGLSVWHWVQGVDWSMGLFKGFSFRVKCSKTGGKLPQTSPSLNVYRSPDCCVEALRVWCDNSLVSGSTDVTVTSKGDN